MRSEISIIFDARRSVNLQADVAPTPEAALIARRWLTRLGNSWVASPCGPAARCCC
jgi:hypothetical protein